MKVIRNRIIPIGKNLLAINLFGVIFAKGDCSARTLRHEAIHTAQMRELLFIFFYLWYVIEWLIRLIQYRNFYRAYQEICFEREAYAKESDLEYFVNRPRYAFLSHLSKT